MLQTSPRSGIRYRVEYSPCKKGEILNCVQELSVSNLGQAKGGADHQIHCANSLMSVTEFMILL